MDGSRTGVGVLTADNSAEALGTFANKQYISPNGTSFGQNTASYKAATSMASVQAEISPLKKVIAHSNIEMLRGEPNSPLGLWIVDHISDNVSKHTDRKVDVGIINIGGVREDLPKGPVMMSDFMAILPFKNYLAYVSLKGSDLYKLFELMAKKPQHYYGVEMHIKNKKLTKLLIDGKAVDTNKYYGVATVDFLLDGGDGINVAKNANELIITDLIVMDSIISYARTLSNNQGIEYYPKQRVYYE